MMLMPMLILTSLPPQRKVLADDADVAYDADAKADNHSDADDDDTG